MTAMKTRVQVARETTDRTVRTGRNAEGMKVREEVWDGQTKWWNATEGREATEAEVETVRW